MERNKYSSDDEQIEGLEERDRKHWSFTMLLCLAILCLLYIFLFALELMSTSFKLLGGRSAGHAFKLVDNPITGLTVGIFATVLVQSSSTSTSIIVSMVGANIVSVNTAVPMIMGANIGTSITNTLVSLAHARIPHEFERAFAGATVHDMFNFLSVLVLLPIEIASGMLERLSGEITSGLTGGSGSEWEGPIKRAVSPLVEKILVVDKSKIKKISKGEEVSGSLIADGVFKNAGMSDNAVGFLCLFVSLVILCIALYLLVKCLQTLVKNAADKWLRKALRLNGYLGILVGCGITILVQSSSITTSTLVPLIACGVVDLEHAYPIALGANIGTTVTALLASLTSDNIHALQIALVHLLFNIIGILIWFPLPIARKVPLMLSAKLGREVRKRRWVAIVYLLMTFVIIPLSLIGLSEISLIVGVIGVCFWILAGSIFFSYIWVRRNRPELIPNFLPPVFHPEEEIVEIEIFE